MKGKLQYRNLFIYIFNLGLILLLFDYIAKNSRYIQENFDFLALNSIPFFAIGLIICLISIPFLMIEWLSLPLGTYSKRIILYKHLGKFVAVSVLIASWFWSEELFFYTNSYINESAAVTLTLGVLLSTILFGWLSGQIAGFISKKRSNTERLDFMRMKKLSSDKKIADLGNKIPPRTLNGSTTPATQN